MERFALEDFVNTGRYPVAHPESAEYRSLVRDARAMLARDGCAVLPGFVAAEGAAILAAEAERVSEFAWRSRSRTNAYFSRDDETLPPSHPLRRFYDRTNAFVPADNFVRGESPLRFLYEHPALMPFVREALAEREFYRYADPLADVIVNMLEPGEPGAAGGFPWHFDTNSYTVTLAIQSGERGGVFEYCPNARAADDENYEGVRRILDGESDAVVSLPLAPGDLQIFRGRHALHRVTPVTGSRPRYVAIFSFASIPDMVASPERCRQLYGRVLPVHLEKARARDDSLRD
ncbi:MAG: HalD/BesD family halogenase [Gammaproteobacteria bacterium]